MSSQTTVVEQTQLLIGLKREQLENLPWAVAKLNREGILIYGNRKMCAIAGVETIEGRSIAELFRGEILQAVRGHLKNRFATGVADEYTATLTRPEDGVEVPILISAMPEFNDEGKTVSVIAFVRDLLAAEVSQNLHKAIETLRDSHELLDTVARECQRIVSFDILGVTLYSEDGEHARSLYIYPMSQFRPTTRWNQMSDYAKKFVESKAVINEPDLKEFFNRPEWAQYRNDADVVQVLKIGLRSSLSIRVVSGGRVVASLGFGRKKEKGPFTQDEQDKLLALPLDAAVRMAIQQEKNGEMEFALKLIRQIASVSNNIEEIARTLTEQIAEQYHFDNVSIFQVDEEQGYLLLLKQHAESESARMPEGYRHRIEKGVTGHVYRTGEAINIPDVSDPRYKEMYLPAYEAARSELCIPIPRGQRTRFLLNLEDARKNAFAKEEQQALEHIIDEVVVVLELITKTQIFSELLKHSKDAIIQTDLRGTIKETNPATEELLGYTGEEMTGMPLHDYFKDKQEGQRVQDAKYVLNDEFAFQHKNGAGVPLLVSGTTLPQYVGLKIYVCNDLSNRKRMETMEILRHMYNEIATQIKTPLSLAFTWLEKLQQMENRAEAASLLGKTIKQLKKVDLTYDRLLLYERHDTIAPADRIVFEIPYLADKIKHDMPDSEAAHLAIISQGEVPPVRADLSQLWFCFESVIGYLVRFVPETNKVSVNISSRAGRVVTVISGYAPPVTGGAIADYAKVQWAIHAITEMALGEDIIKKFIEQNHQGQFSKRRAAGDVLEYTIELPGITEGAQ